MGVIMYKATVMYDLISYSLFENTTSFYDSIEQFENEITKVLQEKGKEMGFHNAVIVVESQNGDGQSFIYEANNINNDKLSLRKIYDLLLQDGEKEAIIIASAYDKDNTQYSKRAMRVSRDFSILTFIGVLLSLQSVYFSLKRTHSIKSFDFLFNSAIFAIFAAAFTIGIGCVLDEALYYFIDKRNQKKDKSLMLIKE